MPSSTAIRFSSATPSWGRFGEKENAWELRDQGYPVRTRAFPIASDERQRLLTFSRPYSPFRAAVIASFQGDAVQRYGSDRVSPKKMRRGPARSEETNDLGFFC